MHYKHMANGRTMWMAYPFVDKKILVIIKHFLSERRHVGSSMKSAL